MLRNSEKNRKNRKTLINTGFLTAKVTANEPQMNRKKAQKQIHHSMLKYSTAFFYCKVKNEYLCEGFVLFLCLRNFGECVRLYHSPFFMPYRFI